MVVPNGWDVAGNPVSQNKIKQHEELKKGFEILKFPIFNFKIENANLYKHDIYTI